ncbi:hypothetical protein ACIQH5_10975 [Paenarthrobacter sp. NPDC091711]|uniref:hypothetical protein n=1 Tax=Paenarthrobacter sp. NPDC091711 TaxID=3364385 RepID=UPI00381AB6BE
MDELIKQGQWWWILVPVLTALAGAWVGARLTRTTEHKQWLRNQKVEAYTNILRQVNAAIGDLDAAVTKRKTSRGDSLKDITDTSNARLELIAASQVKTNLRLVEELRRACHDAAIAGNMDAYKTSRGLLGRMMLSFQRSMSEDLEATERVPLRHRVSYWLRVQRRRAADRWEERTILRRRP